MKLGRRTAAMCGMVIGGLCAGGLSGAAVPASAQPVPPVSDAARAVGFVDVRSVVPDAVIDLRYATAANFVGVALFDRDAPHAIPHGPIDGGAGNGHVKRHAVVGSGQRFYFRVRLVANTFSFHMSAIYLAL